MAQGKKRDGYWGLLMTESGPGGRISRIVEAWLLTGKSASEDTPGCGKGVAETLTGASDAADGLGAWLERTRTAGRWTGAGRRL